ncbi:MDM10 [Sanghuangporus sanghuang]
MGVLPFSTYVLRKYYQATGWNEDNFYSNLTRSSDALLDFTVPRGLQFSISKAPNALFRTSYSINALPSLNGSIGYMFSTCELDLKKSGDVRFKDIVERFKVHGIPKRPEDKEEEWLGGERVDCRDYLLSGLFYIPSGQLDALYTTRWSATTQFSAACILTPLTGASASNPPPLSSEDTMLMSVQHDTGRWGSEYTWQAESGGSILGLRVLRNFGKLANGNGSDVGVVYPAGTSGGDESASKEVPASSTSTSRTTPKRVDEEDAMEGGLKGRLSAGAEFYVSTEKSAGVSAGVRFTTLPNSALQTNLSSSSNSASSSSPSSISSPKSGSLWQPPTICTATFSPITGHFTAAYASKVSRDVALCSRFTFNINSYESEWTMGGEWWLRSKKQPQQFPSSPDLSDLGGEAPATSTTMTAELSSTSEPIPAPDTFTLSGSTEPPLTQESGQIQGVVKARLSTSSEFAFMWEGRLSNALISFGVISNLVNRSKPINSIGLEFSYFSSE